jgi:hypothetical protein
MNRSIVLVVKIGKEKIETIVPEGSKEMGQKDKEICHFIEKHKAPEKKLKISFLIGESEIILAERGLDFENISCAGEIERLFKKVNINRTGLVGFLEWMGAGWFQLAKS